MLQHIGDTHVSYMWFEWTKQHIDGIQASLLANALFQQYVPLLASPDISWHIYIFDMHMHILGETIEQMQEWLSRRPIDISGDHLPCLLAVTRFLNKEWDDLDSKGRSLHRLHICNIRQSLAETTCINNILLTFGPSCVCAFDVHLKADLYWLDTWDPSAVCTISFVWFQQWKPAHIQKWHR